MGGMGQGKDPSLCLLVKFSLGKWTKGPEPGLRASQAEDRTEPVCVFQDSDLKQYLDHCGNLMNMHNVKVRSCRERL